MKDKPTSETERPHAIFHFEAIPEDEQVQDELNRRLHKPGEPSCRTPIETATPMPDSQHGPDQTNAMEPHK